MESFHMNWFQQGQIKNKENIHLIMLVIQFQVFFSASVTQRTYKHSENPKRIQKKI